MFANHPGKFVDRDLCAFTRGTNMAIKLEREFVPPLVASGPFISPSMLCVLFIGFVSPLVTTPTDILLGDRPARFALHVSHLRAKEQAMARVRSSNQACLDRGIVPGAPPRAEGAR